MDQALESISRRWPQSSQDAFQEMIDKYGQPNEYSASQAIWHYNGPWKRSVVQSEESTHDFPDTHVDVLEQFIDYHVPVEKYDELARYDGSVIVERTKGLISARCAGEEMNFVAINLAHDIVTGERSVEDARQEYTRLYQVYQNDEKPASTQGFLFDPPQGSTGDPDVKTIG
jgi:hypothetical protein